MINDSDNWREREGWAQIQEKLQAATKAAETYEQLYVEELNKRNYSPIEVATALALYGYNVSAYDRARKIYEHFDGYCPDMDDLIRYMEHYGCAATALPFPSAEVYVKQALEKYGEEAKRRVRVEREVRLILPRMLNLQKEQEKK